MLSSTHGVILHTVNLTGNIREVLIFANFAGTDSRIQETRENYYHSATEEK